MKKFISTVLLIVMIVSALSVSAFAANTTDTSYFVTTPGYGFTYISAREKLDSSAVYAKITGLSVNDKVRVRVEGSTSSNGSFYNCTLSNNGDAGYVVLTENINYSIHTMVNERGYSYARLGFQSVDWLKGETVGGWWSPDSYGTYTDAV